MLTSHHDNLHVLSLLLRLLQFYVLATSAVAPLPFSFHAPPLFLHNETITWYTKNETTLPSRGQKCYAYPSPELSSPTFGLQQQNVEIF